MTDAGKAILQTSEFEPYGKVVNRAEVDGPSYTGHVQDASSGLTYMQQRYYDPMIGRFLSVDPVTADSATGANFNRYWYANNNPYKFTDPDGRMIRQNKSQMGDCMPDPPRNPWGGGPTDHQLGEGGDDGSESSEGVRWDGQINTTPGGGLKSAVGGKIKSFLDAGFAASAFDRYWYGDGDYTLSQGQFNALVAVSAGLKVIDSMSFEKNGMTYLAEKFKFYGTSFASTIGAGWLISDASGQKVGFYDRYDFNSKPLFGDRRLDKEIQTRMVDVAGAIFRAQSYDISYGIYTDLP